MINCQSLTTKKTESEAMHTLINLLSVISNGQKPRGNLDIDKFIVVKWSTCYTISSLVFDHLTLPLFSIPLSIYSWVFSNSSSFFCPYQLRQSSRLKPWKSHFPFHRWFLLSSKAPFLILFLAFQHESSFSRLFSSITHLFDLTSRFSCKVLRDGTSSLSLSELTLFLHREDHTLSIRPISSLARHLSR